MSKDDIPQIPFIKKPGPKGTEYIIKRQSSGVAPEVTMTLSPKNDHIAIEWRAEKPGCKGRELLFRWDMDSVESIQTASVLLQMAKDIHNYDEVPKLFVVTDREKAGFGENFVMAEMEQALMFRKRLASRSQLYALMRRFLETCDDDALVYLMISNLMGWAQDAADPFAQRKAELALEQFSDLTSSSLLPNVE